MQITHSGFQESETTKTEKLALKALFKQDIFSVLAKYEIPFESKIAEEFRAIIEKMNFIPTTNDS